MPCAPGERQITRRNQISTILLTGLIGLALKEMVFPVGAAIKDHGLTFRDAVLLVSFLCTAFRFFVGNMNHLLEPKTAGAPGRFWFLDLCVILIESLLLVVLAGLTSEAANLGANIQFVQLVLALYVLDIGWIASQVILANRVRSWHREPPPWQWAALNSCLVAGTLLLWLLIGGTHLPAMFIWLGVSSLTAFFIDVVIVDQSEVFRARQSQPVPTG